MIPVVVPVAHNIQGMCRALDAVCRGSIANVIN